MSTAQVEAVAARIRYLRIAHIHTGRTGFDGVSAEVVNHAVFHRKRHAAAVTRIKAQTIRPAMYIAIGQVIVITGFSKGDALPLSGNGIVALVGKHISQAVASHQNGLLQRANGHQCSLHAQACIGMEIELCTWGQGKGYTGSHDEAVENLIGPIALQNGVARHDPPLLAIYVLGLSLQDDTADGATLGGKDEFIGTILQRILVLLGRINKEEDAHTVARCYLEIARTAACHCHSVDIDAVGTIAAARQTYLGYADGFLRGIVHHKGIGACGLSAEDGVERDGIFRKSQPSIHGRCIFLIGHTSSYAQQQAHCCQA